MTQEPNVSLVDCGGLTTREINRAVRAAFDSGAAVVRLRNPAARHNLGVALREGERLVIDGSAGYYVGGLNDGATIEVHGSAGWGAGESMRDGVLIIDGNAGNAVAASIRGGLVVVRGDASTRAGIAMKGGALVVAGDTGPNAGFLMQKGVIVIGGNAGDGLADSMYLGTIYLGGDHGELGADAVEEPFEEADRDLVFGLLEQGQVSPPASGRFRKLVSGRRLWNFHKADLELWKAAL